MAGLRFSYLSVTGQFSKAMQEVQKPIAEAGTAALRQVGEIGKKDGRASIAAAGFSKRWQNATRFETYPRKKASLGAATLLFNAVPYAEVFELGATIRGKPRLWVPLSSTPRLSGNKKLSPQTFQSAYGKLFAFRAGSKTLLGAAISVTEAAARRGPPYKVTKAGLKRGAAGEGIIRTVPVFVGVDSVQIGKRFDLLRAFGDAADQLPALYLQNLKV